MRELRSYYGMTVPVMKPKQQEAIVVFRPVLLHCPHPSTLSPPPPWLQLKLGPYIYIYIYIYIYSYRPHTLIHFPH